MIKKSLFLFLVTMHLTTYTADLNTLMLSACELRAQQEQEEKEEAFKKELQQALAAKRRREEQKAKQLKEDRLLAESLANPRRELTREIKLPNRYNPDDHSVPKRTLSKARKRTGKTKSSKAERHFNQKSMGPLGIHICATCVFSHRDPKVVKEHYITHWARSN